MGKSTLSDRIAIVTGAGSGIGAALAISLSQLGVHVVLAGRRGSALEATQKQLSSTSTSMICPTDLVQAEQIQNLVQQTIQRFGRIDIVMNNAGIALGGFVPDISPTEVKYLIDVNLIAPIWLTQLTLPYLLQSKSGILVNVNSMSGILPMASQAVYCGSKFGLHGFTEALRFDLEGTSVKVIGVYPGPVDSEMNTPKVREQTVKHNVRVVAKDPMDAANIIIRAMLRSQRRVIVGSAPEKIMAFMYRHFPTVFRKLARRIDPAMHDFMVYGNQWTRERMRDSYINEISPRSKSTRD